LAVFAVLAEFADNELEAQDADTTAFVILPEIADAETNDAVAAVVINDAVCANEDDNAYDALTTDPKSKLAVAA
jgi:hypothetical protein